MNNNYSYKDFIPLLLIVSGIIVGTILKQALSNHWDLYSCMHDFMGIFFITFALIKIVNLTAFAQAYARYDLIAMHSSAYSFAYPFMELALGIAYISRTFLIITYWITLIIMIINALGVFRALQQKQHLTCACLGAIFKIPMTYVTLAEDVLMAIMALIMIITSPMP